jgi:hypothetical protein
MTTSTDPAPRVDWEASQKARLESVKTLMIEVLEKGIGALLPTAIDAVNADGKCGCNDVCGCKSICGGC